MKRFSASSSPISLRLPVDDRQQDHAERDLHLRELVQIVQDDFGLLAALQLEDDAHAVAVALVANFGDPFEALLVDQPRRVLDQAGLVDLVGQFLDDDRLAILAHVLGLRQRAQLDGPAAVGEVVVNPLPAQDDAAGREIGTRHQLGDLGKTDARILHQRDAGVDDLGDIVRRDLARHAHRDAFAAVDQQVRNPRGKHFRLDFLLVVIGLEIDGLFVDVFQQLGRDARQPRFGVPHGRGRIAVHGAVISLPVDQRIAHRKRLRHADQGVVNRRVAVRMELTHDVADHAGGLLRGAVIMQPHLVHHVENPPMHGLQPVADVRQRAPHDHAHGVIEVRALHLVFDVDGDQVLRPTIAA